MILCKFYHSLLHFAVMCVIMIKPSKKTAKGYFLHLCEKPRFEFVGTYAGLQDFNFFLQIFLLKTAKNRL